MVSLALYTYSTVPRGSVVHTAHLADALHDAGWSVTVYALDKDRRGFYRPLRAGLCLVPAGPAPPTTVELVRQRRAELAGYLARHPPVVDLHHAQDCLTASALLDLRDAGHPLALLRTVHHVERFADPALARCQERSIREAARCLTVSRAARRDVARTFGIEAPSVGNGVDLARFAAVDGARVEAWRRRLGDGGPVVLAVGGVEERKNSLRLLRAFALLRRIHPGARLLILGGASVLDHEAYRVAFEEERHALAVGAAVVELGVVPDEEVPALYHLADVLALPSLHEGFGLAALEALAAGLPLLASDRPPFTEYLDPTCATLVDPRSEEAIAAGLGRALDGDPLRREAGRRRAAAHAWSRVAARHLPHYRPLLARKKEIAFDAGDAFRRSLA